VTLKEIAFSFNRNGHGSINCNTFFAGFNPDRDNAIKYGGTDGKGSSGCPSGFVGVGYLCFKFPIQDAVFHNEMGEACSSLGAIPYAPINLVQNVVVKGLTKITVL
jgi:hypothetical protein